MCVCCGLGRGAAGLEKAVVGGVNPTHYNSSLWPVLGKGLQGPTAVSYQYVFLLFHLSKWPLTAWWLGSLSLSMWIMCKYFIVSYTVSLILDQNQICVHPLTLLSVKFVLLLCLY